MCWWMALPLAAQTNSITVGRHQAHPTRLLAKFADANQAATPASAAVLHSLGLTAQSLGHLVPGLVTLDVSEEEKAAVADPATRAQQLVDRIAALRHSGLFAYVEPDYVVKTSLTPNDSAFVNGNLWGLRNNGQLGGRPGADINAVQAWDITTGSTNVIVAVIDTGVRYTHVDLAAQMWQNPGEIPANQIDDDNNGYVDDVFGINAIDGVPAPGDPMDDIGHGTHVAGTIGAAANNGQPHVGVAWKVQLMACKFLGTAGGLTSDAIECIGYAVRHRARIMNNSWGGYGYSQALFDSIAAARANGILFVAAAGNEANDNDIIPAYPASYQLDNIVAVAAVDRYDNLA
ncbi:MAG: S8 family serine peptidase, partial [Chloroflexi bacterium]|nr:S8 family serine peptidase [Chloroflexota bacterium]